jgi:hypothetical protein
MEPRFLETLERFTKSKISDDVECCEVEPGAEINGLPGIFTHTLHEKCRVLGDDGFLFHQGLVGEYGGHDAALSGMFHMTDLPEHAQCTEGLDLMLAIDGIQRHRLFAFRTSTYILPSLGGYV